MRSLIAIAITLVAALADGTANAQWTNRYPKVSGVNAHTYLEGFNLPTLSSGPPIPHRLPMGARLRSPRMAGCG